MRTLGSILLAALLVGLWIAGAVGLAEGVRWAALPSGWVLALYPAYCGLWLWAFGGPGPRHPRWFDWR